MAVRRWLAFCVSLAAVTATCQVATAAAAAAAAAVSTVGTSRLYAMRASLAARGVTSFFSTMDKSGFTPIVANALGTSDFTFLVPTNAVWARYQAYVKRLTKGQQQQLIGYHILAGNYPLSYLAAAPYKAEFPTADYKFTVAKFSRPKAKVGFGRPKSNRNTAYIARGNAYKRPKVMVHIITGILVPEKYL